MRLSLASLLLLLGVIVGLAFFSGSRTAGAAEPPASFAGTLGAKGDGPPLTHRVRGMENCIRCHPVGRGRSPMPQDHAGYTNDGCLACHPAPIP